MKQILFLLLVPLLAFSQKITVAIDYDYAPMTYKSFEGKPEGFLVEFWKLWAKKSGYEVEFKFYNWDGTLKAVKDGEVIFHSGLTPDEKWMKKSKKFYEVKTSFYKLQNKQLPKKLTIGSIDPYYMEVAKQHYPNAKIVKYGDYLPLIKDTISGKIDLFIDDEIAVNNFLLKQGVKTKFQTLNNSLISDVYAITNEKNKKYLKIFNKYLKDITLNEMITLEDEVLGKNNGIYNVKKENNILFTKKEQKWLNKHEVVTYTYDPDWAPFEFNNGINTHKGIIADILKIIQQKSGIKFQAVSAPTWSDAVKLVKNKKVDMFSAVQETKERKKYLNFTKRYIFKYFGSFVCRAGENYDINNLKGKKVGIMKDYVLGDFVKNKYPNLNYVYIDSTKDGFKQLKNKQIDIFVINIVTANYHIKQKHYSDIKILSKIDFEFKLKIALLKDKPKEIISILDKTIKSIDKNEIEAIYNKWVNTEGIVLTNQEKLYLKNQKTIRYVYDPHREPFEYTNNLNKHSGITADILKLVKEKSGLKFEAVPTQSWEESKKLMEQNQADMFTFVIPTDERKKYLNFTDKVLFKIPVVFVTHVDDEKIYENVKFDLKDKKIGIVKGRAIQKKLLQRFPKLHFVTINSVEEGLKKVTNKELDMIALNKSTAKYYIKVKGFNKTKIATSVDIFFEFKIAMQKSMPKEAFSILNKSLNLISDEKINKIYNSYVDVKIYKKNVDWKLIAQIGFIIFLIVLFLVWNNQRLKNMVDEKTKELSILLQEFNDNVIASKTDLKGRITYASKAFCDICEYTEEELIGKPHNIVRHPDVPKEAFRDMWATIKAGKVWKGEVKNKKKSGGYYWVDAVVIPEFDKNGNIFGYSAIQHDITAKKDIEELTKNLESIVQERTKELKTEKEFIQTLLDSQEQLIITTLNGKLESANKTFFDFFVVDTIEEFKEVYNAKCICDMFNQNAPKDYIQKETNGLLWIEYVLDNPNSKVKISIFGHDYIFNITASNLPNKKGLKSAVFTNITDIENAKIEIETINKHMKDSIEYASLIQSALIPDHNVMKNYFKDMFVIWHPKDVVGGDIYLFEELRQKDECLLIVMDCTGHGVPGAFVTMLVKAIERQITTKINHSDEVVSPAKLLSVFNKNMKQLLKQDGSSSFSNVGMDGQIIYFNKTQKIVKCASARNEIFYYQDDELHVIKGDRHSLGYVDSNINFEFKEHTIDVSKETTFYVSSDGYWDQNGGEKNLPYGKKRLKKMLNEIYMKPMAEQQDEFLYTFKAYKGNNIVNDDVTVIGFKI